MSVRKTSSSKVGKTTGLAGRIEETPPPGVAPVLRTSWKFARKTAQKFSRELMKDRVGEFLKKLAKRFVA
jgi:hypothetical protein